MRRTRTFFTLLLRVLFSKCCQLFILVHVCTLWVTVNVDSFACVNYRAFPKISNFARIYIRVFGIVASMGHSKYHFFHCVHIFADI